VGNVAVFQINDLIGGTCQCQGVGSQEILVIAQTHYQGRTLAGTNHTMRLVAAEHSNGVSPFQTAHCTLHSIEQIVVVQVVDQVGNHFSVGLAFKHITLLLQLGAQLVVVFNNAVVHQGNARVFRVFTGNVRVSI